VNSFGDETRRWTDIASLYIHFVQITHRKHNFKPGALLSLTAVLFFVQLGFGIILKLFHIGICETYLWKIQIT